MWSAQNFETKLSGDFSNSLKSNAINTSKFSTFPTELSQRTCMSVRPLRSERPRGAQRKPVTSTQKQIVFVTPATQPLLITKALSLTQHLLLKLAGMSEWANSNKSCQRSKKKRRKKSGLKADCSHQQTWPLSDPYVHNKLISVLDQPRPVEWSVGANSVRGLDRADTTCSRQL